MVIAYIRFCKFSKKIVTLSRCINERINVKKSKKRDTNNCLRLARGESPVGWGGGDTPIKSG